ncbi:MAG: 30S ribosomal protein S3 [Patescibacteria group bacterium]|nr:30S ribosomal protein S3 [Patescibacteria group bacterium]
MSHKVHPKAFRLKEWSDWDSRWFNEKELPKYLEEDFRIREFLKKRLKEAAVQNIEIERSPNQVNIIINTARPGLLIGRGGAGVDDMKKEIEKQILKGKRKKEVKIEIKEVKDPWAQASISGQWIASQIEKRMPFRRVMKKSLDKIMTSNTVKGARIEVSGRLNGAQISRREWLSKGNLPRQVLRAEIDYAQKEAFCSYGVTGIKVWIYKGKKFEKQTMNKEQKTIKR